MNIQKLSVTEVVSEVVSITTRKKLDVIIAITPLVIVFSLLFVLSAKIFGTLDRLNMSPEKLSSMVPDAKYMFIIFLLIIYGLTKTAVNCHRIYLKRSNLYFTDAVVPKMRDLKFLGTGLLLSLIAIPIAFGAGFILAIVMPLLASTGVGGLQSLSWVIFVGVYLLIGLIISRFMLVLPSRAVDEALSLGDSWEATSSVKWKVFFLLAILPIFSSLTTEYLATLDWWFFALLSVVLQAIFALFELALLSLCYQKLVVEVRNKEREALYM